MLECIIIASQIFFYKPDSELIVAHIDENGKLTTKKENITYDQLERSINSCQKLNS